MAYGRQTGPGVPGSFPLPNPGNTGNAFKANVIHPAAQIGRGMATQGGRPAPAGKK
jgi:hypothetical protein